MEDYRQARDRKTQANGLTSHAELRRRLSRFVQGGAELSELRKAADLLSWAMLSDETHGRADLPLTILDVEMVLAEIAE